MQNTRGSSRQQILQTTEETWQQAHQGWVSLSKHTNHCLPSPSFWLFVHVSNSEHNTRCQSRAENETTVNPLHPRAAWHCSPCSKKGLKREHQHSQMWWAGETLPNCRHERPWQFSFVSKWHLSRWGRFPTHTEKGLLDFNTKCTKGLENTTIWLPREKRKSRVFWQLVQETAGTQASAQLWVLHHCSSSRESSSANRSCSLCSNWSEFTASWFTVQSFNAQTPHL